MTNSIQNHWQEIGEKWPDPIQLRKLKTLPGFPYSQTYIRNLSTGSKPDPYLIDHVFRIGKYPAIRKDALITWLHLRTA